MCLYWGGGGGEIERDGVLRRTILMGVIEALNLNPEEEHTPT